MANACQYADFFTALRGGVGGTFGVVVSATIKAHPTRAVLAHTLLMTPSHGNLIDLVNAFGEVLSKYSILSNRGFGGNGELLNMDGAILYTHTFIKLLDNNPFTTIERAKQFMNQQVVKNLLPLNRTKLYITSSFNQYPTFQKFVLAGNHQAHAEDNLLMISRFFDNKSLVSRQENLSKVLRTLFTRQVQWSVPLGLGLPCLLLGVGKC